MSKRSHLDCINDICVCAYACVSEGWCGKCRILLVVKKTEKLKRKKWRWVLSSEWTGALPNPKVTPDESLWWLEGIAVQVTVHDSVFLRSLVKIVTGLEVIDPVQEVSPCPRSHWLLLPLSSHTIHATWFGLADRSEYTLDNSCVSVMPCRASDKFTQGSLLTGAIPYVPPIKGRSSYSMLLLRICQSPHDILIGIHKCSAWWKNIMSL